MTKYMVIKQDTVTGIKYYEKSDGHFSRNMLEAAEFSKRTAEKHVESIIKSFNAFMRARVRVSAEETEETDTEELTSVA